MITGTVGKDGLPTVLLAVAGQTWRATIDTGFNGDLELSHHLAPLVNPRFFARGRSILAGGQSVEEDHYLVEFPFDGRIVKVVATFTPGDEILIGTRLLRHYRLEIDCVARTVALARVA